MPFIRLRRALMWLARPNLAWFLAWHSRHLFQLEIVPPTPKSNRQKLCIRNTHAHTHAHTHRTAHTHPRIAYMEIGDRRWWRRRRRNGNMFCCFVLFHFLCTPSAKYIFLSSILVIIVFALLLCAAALLFSFSFHFVFFHFFFFLPLSVVVVLEHKWQTRATRKERKKKTPVVSIPQAKSIK